MLITVLLFLCIVTNALYLGKILTEEVEKRAKFFVFCIDS